MTLNFTKGVFSEFFVQFLVAVPISTLNCDEMAEIHQENLHVKFSAFNVDFSSSSPDPIGSRRPAQVGVKDGNPP